jgi:hypothetical protein
MKSQFKSPSFKSSDSVLQQLVAERRKEVEYLQESQVEQLKEIESKGQRQLRSLMTSLPKESLDLMQKLDKAHEENISSVESDVADIKAKFAKPFVEALEPTIEHPGFTQGRLIAPQISGSWLTPYYATYHGSDGTVYWQGYNPGNFDVRDWASGAGSGLFGTGAASFTVYVDWWFTFTTDTSRFYSHNIYVPFNGFYIVRSDDGFWDSKEAHVRIDLSAQGYQYNWKPSSSTNVLDIDSQNINVNDRFDGWRTMYYSDLLGGGDAAYVRVTSSFYVYARGGGSYAELNFSDGAANYIGVPWVYIS